MSAEVISLAATAPEVAPATSSTARAAATRALLDEDLVEGIPAR
jgi:hypothetical protein